MAIDLQDKVKSKISELEYGSDKPEAKAIVDNLIHDTHGMVCLRAMMIITSLLTVKKFTSIFICDTRQLHKL